MFVIRWYLSPYSTRGQFYFSVLFLSMFFLQYKESLIAAKSTKQKIFFLGIHIFVHIQNLGWSVGIVDTRPFFWTVLIYEHECDRFNNSNNVAPRAAKPALI